ncbi:MAG TPA: hypothetical protein VGN05_14760 [Parvibaculum sp.]|jgi:hypothetical protein
MYVTRRARRLAPSSFRILLGAAMLIGAGALCLAIIVAYGWGVAGTETSSHAGQNVVFFTTLVALLIGFVFWLWRQLLMSLQEMGHNRELF